jgi:hypothetical protein
VTQAAGWKSAKGSDHNLTKFLVLSVTRLHPYM